MQVFRKIRVEFVDLSRSVAVYLATVTLVSTGVTLLLIAGGVSLGSPAAVLSLALIAAISEWRGRIALRGNLTVSISLFPSVFAAVLFGPLAAMLVFSASALGLNMPLPGRLAYVCNRA